MCLKYCSESGSPHDKIDDIERTKQAVVNKLSRKEGYACCMILHKTLGLC